MRVNLAALASLLTSVALGRQFELPKTEQGECLLPGGPYESSCMSVTLEYCKSRVKGADVTMKSKQRSLDILNQKIDGLQKDIIKAQAAKDQEKITEYQQEIDALEKQKSDTETALNDAKVKYEGTVEKCTKLEKKKNKDKAQYKQ